jgi:transposase
MPKRYCIQLSDAEREQLERWAKNAARPYLRERARAVLQVTQGEPISRVAQHLRVRVHRTTVAEWVRRYQAEGISGLKIKAGRGRKPGFSPSDPATG